MPDPQEKGGSWRGHLREDRRKAVSRESWGKLSDSTLEPDTGRRVPREGARALSKATQGRAKTRILASLPCDTSLPQSHK